MFCECCGLYYQSNKLTLCGTDLDDVAHLGLTTYTFFKAIMHIVLLLVVLLVTFSVYSLGTNIYLGLIKEEYSWGYLLISLTSKSALDDAYLYEIGCWLGLCTVVLWGVCLAVIKYWQLQLQMDTMHCSFYNVSEYSILIEKMPTGLSKEYVQN